MAKLQLWSGCGEVMAMAWAGQGRAAPAMLSRWGCKVHWGCCSWQLREGLHRLRLAEGKPGGCAAVPRADAKKGEDLSLTQSFSISLILIWMSLGSAHRATQHCRFLGHSVLCNPVPCSWRNEEAFQTHWRSSCPRESRTWNSSCRAAHSCADLLCPNSWDFLRLVLEKAGLEKWFCFTQSGMF